MSPLDFAAAIILCFPLTFGIRMLILIVKRLRLLRGIRQRIKGKATLVLRRGRLASLFSRRGSIDFYILSKERKLAVSILSTPYRKSRYHFLSDTSLEIIYARRRVIVTSRFGATMLDNVYTKKTYRLYFEKGEEGFERYLLIHPAAYELSAVTASGTLPLYDGTPLFRGFRVVSGACFREEILRFDQ